MSTMLCNSFFFLFFFFLSQGQCHKLATVKRKKADNSSISPSSEQRDNNNYSFCILYFPFILYIVFI